MHKKFQTENPKGRDHSEALGVDVKIKSERVLGKQGGKVQTGFIWLWIWNQWLSLVYPVMNLRFP